MTLQEFLHDMNIEVTSNEAVTDDTPIRLSNYDRDFDADIQEIKVEDGVIWIVMVE